MDMRPFSVTFLNRKGGVGKSSSVYHLAGTFAGPLNKRVLVCDLDPQGSLGQGYFGPEFVEALPKEKTAAALFDDAFDPSPEELIIPTGVENIWILPANNELTDHNTSKPEKSPYQNALRDFLAEVENDFDVILIDCPPNLQLCSWASLLASSLVVVPVVPEDFSSQGLVYVQQAIDKAMTTRNPKLRLLGYLLTLYDTRISDSQKLTRSCFASSIRILFSTKSCTAGHPSRRPCRPALPVVAYKPKSDAAPITQKLCEEMLRRVPVFAQGLRSSTTPVIDTSPGLLSPRIRSCDQSPQSPRRRTKAMGKSEALIKRLGGNLAESIGVRKPPTVEVASTPPQTVPTTSSKDGFTRLRSAGEMLLANIIPDPTQPRKEFDKDAIDRLAESIKKKGLLQPLRVRWDAAVGKHIILVGERRYRASVAAGLEAVPCIFVESELTAAEILEEQLVENLLREDLNPIEEAESFKRYMDLLGCPAKELAHFLKISPSKVTRAMSLLKLPESIQEQLAEGSISPVTGYELSKVTNPAVQEEMAKKVVEKGLTATETANAVRQKKGKAAGKKRGTGETFRLTGGVKVVVSATRNLSRENVVAALEEALEQAKHAV